MLVLDYLQRTEQTNPELKLKAEKYVATGYQRLVSYEVPGGGYSLFGQAPAGAFLTAYGLMEFTDMAKVYPVDEAMLNRTATWLLNQQQPDGTWVEQGYSEHWRIDAELPTTAYITWSLIEAGYADTPQIETAIAYIRQASGQEEDAYGLALIANALTAYDPDHPTTQAVLDKLYANRIQQDETVYWENTFSSFMGATGNSGSIETTALIASAFIKANQYPDAITGALAWLIQNKDDQGTWGTTQATILALKTLLQATEFTGSVDEPVTVQVSLNKEQTQEIVINSDNSDVVHIVTFDKGFSATGANRVQLEVDGDSNLTYQVSSGYYLPWSQAPTPIKTEELIDIEVAYDRTKLAVNDTVNVAVDLKLNQEGMVKMALVDLGLPPGFSVLTEDLSRLVEQGVIQRYELTGRQIIIYLEDFSSEQPLSFSYRLRARFPLRAQTAPSAAYDYYNPTAQTTQAPLEMVVTE